ncbi:Ribosomal protein L7/L12 C-terminal domain family protein [Babesia bovis T2Bo]|uniref:50S ribosomal protein L12 n=1 Tax=Babesia bovis TaxID=5865 RepID=A7AMW1_BABBO|nr:Ribosomal protein L7/L12 C-terminal domain family protein [Babesia bovis T2Bo]EDO07895.1 Ribosomal protein L7/L12 C-terminal domain family protein [Babesia bovis T2Bo]|eukprot:XP_001611463.1 hypothetical protein [Babesia bovis T2Bo]
MVGIPQRCARPSPPSDADSSAIASHNVAPTHALAINRLPLNRLRGLGLFVTTVLLGTNPVYGLRYYPRRSTNNSCAFISNIYSCKTGFAQCRGLELHGSKVDDILEDLKTLTLLETSELVKKIEETFGVSASMAVSAAPAVSSGPAVAAPAEEDDDEDERKKKTSFEVVLLERPEEQSVRMALFRMLRKVMPDKPLTEVKAAIDNAPSTLKVCGREEEAKEALKIIEGAGGKAEIR